MSETALEKQQQPRAVATVGARGLELSNMDELVRFSAAVAKSGLAPKGLQTPEAIFVAVQLGLELGLTPMAALQNIASINGRPRIYGDAALALVRSCGHLESYKESMVGEQGTDSWGCKVVSKRKGFDPVESVFTVGEAKTASLWGKPGPWKEYPARMLKFRARGFNLRDNFGDVLGGLKTAEEAQDEPVEPVSIMTISPVTEEAIEDDGKPILPPEKKPVETVSPPTRQAKGPQAELAEIITNAGFTFDQFRTYAGELGTLSDPTSVDDWDGVPDKEAKRMLNAKTGMLKGMNTAKEEGKL